MSSWENKRAFFLQNGDVPTEGIGTVCAYFFMTVCLKLFSYRFLKRTSSQQTTVRVRKRELSTLFKVLEKPVSRLLLVQPDLKRRMAT